MKTIDHYTNFEGEPEIQLVQEGNIPAVLRIWTGWFDAIRLSKQTK
jgi:hypothetical protein